MTRKPQLVTVPQEISHRPFVQESANSGPRKIHIYQTRFSNEERSEREDAKEEDTKEEDGKEEDAKEDEGREDEQEVEEEEVEEEEAVVPIGEYPAKKTLWSVVKGFVHKFPFFHSTPIHTNNGPYQPFADRAICLSNYGVVGKGLGEGVSSHVYLLRKTPSHQCLAVKIFRRCKKKDSRVRYMKALVSEFAVTYTLNHPNVLRTIDFVKMDHDYSKFGLIMDYCDQGDLNSLISRRELQPDEIYAFFKQLMQGLKYLHDAGVAHRDLKPENLLLQDNILKIADFGSCDVFRAEGEKQNRPSTGKVGTTPYMAPEVFTDEHYWGATADIWSAAVVFFSMHYTGVPFNSARIQDSNYRHYLRTREEREYASFNEMQPEARALIYTMLNPDCKQRTTVDDILNDPWVDGLCPYYVRECERIKKIRVH
ncbi:hypothetical protein G6F57_006904 [Rhizopus arrhizus]|nr:hypothetical protein G6F23_009751 [Rhizopus arrhizus]KAG1403108.1 hypothetical protein G6F58_010434 [Rhizopus delemar]KAG0768478.1 hypothetical protein G6F24_001911 [Rhizopus arrhizus]KAG0778204.1 hypothetical protein G6F22_011372 [Rhizopus arrhizus]KAG0796998.1 hypothetical protein G6F21_000850 [Rhizopus arrhizus]